MHREILNTKPMSDAPLVPAQSSDYREVIAYLKGVADAATTLSGGQGPLTLRPTTRIPISFGPRPRQPSWISSGTLPPGLGAFPTRSPEPTKSPPDVRASARFDPGAFRMASPFGELPHLTESAWPVVVVGSPAGPARGGARMIDFDASLPALQHHVALAPGGTVPYFTGSEPRVVVLSSEGSFDDEDRASEVRLKVVPLADEWYELAGVRAAASA